jgi:hypothetical protein
LGGGRAVEVGQRLDRHLGPFIRLHEPGLAPERVPDEIPQPLAGEIVLPRVNLFQGKPDLRFHDPPEGPHEPRLGRRLEEQPDVHPGPGLRHLDQRFQAHVRQEQRDGDCLFLPLRVRIRLGRVAVEVGAGAVDL